MVRGANGGVESKKRPESRKLIQSRYSRGSERVLRDGECEHEGNDYPNAGMSGLPATRSSIPDSDPTLRCVESTYMNRSASVSGNIGQLRPRGSRRARFPGLRNDNHQKRIPSAQRVEVKPRGEVVERTVHNRTQE
jgi:hypothetical protein